MAVTSITATLPMALAEALAGNSFKMYMYMEYVNLAANVPKIEVKADIQNFSNPLDYYTGLEATKNFIRVPAIRNPMLATEVTSTSGQATTIYFAQSTDTSTGVLVGAGRPAFGNSSICYGAALVLAKKPEDYTSDIVLARSYFTGTTELLAKSSAAQIFISFPLTVKSNK